MEPELRFAPSGIAVAKLRVVASSRKKNEATGTWEDDKTLWLDVTCFRALAENVVESIAKGDLVTVVGKLSTDEWTTNENEKRSKIVMIADSVAASLAFRTIKHGEGQTTRAAAGASAPANDPWASSGGGVEEPPF